MSHPFQNTASALVESVEASQRRRLLVVFGIPLLFLLVVESAANFGVYPLALAFALAAFLYTRNSEQAMLAAGVAGVGLLLVSLFLFQLYMVGATGSTESLSGAATRLWGWAIAGIALVVLGGWLYRIDI